MIFKFGVEKNLGGSDQDSDADDNKSENDKVSSTTRIKSEKSTDNVKANVGGEGITLLLHTVTIYCIILNYNGIDIISCCWQLERFRLVIILHSCISILLQVKLNDMREITSNGVVDLVTIDLIKTIIPEKIIIAIIDRGIEVVVAVVVTLREDIVVGLLIADILHTVISIEAVVIIGI